MEYNQITPSAPPAILDLSLPFPFCYLIFFIFFIFFHSILIVLGIGLFDSVLS